MKASLKFREDQKPLARVKIPLNILGIPFQSGIVAGNSDELTLNLSTAFHSGPSLRLSYRPNDSANPFSLSVKSGSGPFGSPLSSSITLSVNFNLLHYRNAANPDFTLNFSPSLEMGGVRRFRNFRRNVVEVPTTVAGLLSRMEVLARTEVPVMGKATVVSLRWGVRVPEESRPADSSNFRKFSFLFMDKIGIEHIKGHESKESGRGCKQIPIKKKECKKIDNGVDNTDCKRGGASSDFAEGSYLMRRRLEMLEEDNGEIRKALDELRCEFASERRERRICNSNKKSSSNTSTEYMGKGTEGGVSEELKKA